MFIIFLDENGRLAFDLRGPYFAKAPLPNEADGTAKYFKFAAGFLDIIGAESDEFFNN